MKKISFLFMVIVLLGLLSCGKDGTKVELSSTPTAPVLNLSEATYVLEKQNANEPIMYTWSSAHFGPQVVITYTVQVAKQGNDFADAMVLGVVTNTDTLVITTDLLNNKLQLLEPDPTTPSPTAVEFRVVASVSSYAPNAASTAVNQTITPYYVPIVYPLLFVPGNYQGWNPADSSTVIASVASNEMYEGYLWFPASTEYKFTQGPEWTTNWGDNGGDGTLEPGGANILAPAEGYYKLNVDLTKSPPTHAQLVTTWAVIGDATGSWDVDKPMTYDPVTQVWTITLDLGVGGMKFRANGTWDLNYGDQTAPNGTLVAGGANIPITAAGNYTVTLNLSKPVYRYQLKQN